MLTQDGRIPDVAAADSTDLESLGRYIRSRRQTLGLTQTQLGERLGWLQERVSILENGKYGMPSLPALARLAIACEVPLSEVLAAAGYNDELGSRQSSATAEQPNGTALLYTLQQLLAIDAATMKDALDQAADLVAGVMGADKVDAFMFDASTQSLVVLGASDTEMGRRQHQLGMDRLPLANRGREVQVFETGEVYATGDAKNDPDMLIGIKEGLNVQSFLGVPLTVGGKRQGAVVAVSAQQDQFHYEDIRFFETVARWVGMVAHHADLMESLQIEAVETARRIGAEELLGLLLALSKRDLAPAHRHIHDLKQRTALDGHDEYTGDLQAALRHIVGLERTLQELIDASNLERGLIALNLGRCDVSELVHRIANSMDGSSSPLSVRASIGTTILLDEVRITQALQSLFTNAIQRSPHGVPVIINVDCAEQDAGAWVSVQVQDEGATMSADAVAHVFHHLGAEKGDAFSGLRLYLARAVAEAHNGSLTVQSPGMKGSIFQLSLPIRHE